MLLVGSDVCQGRVTDRHDAQPARRGRQVHGKDAQVLQMGFHSLLVEPAGVVHMVYVHHEEPRGLGIGVLTPSAGEVRLPRHHRQTLIQLGAALIVLLGSNLLQELPQGGCLHGTLEESARADHTCGTDVTEEVERSHQAASPPLAS